MLNSSNRVGNGGRGRLQRVAARASGGTRRGTPAQPARAWHTGRPPWPRDGQAAGRHCRVFCELLPNAQATHPRPPRTRQPPSRSALYQPACWESSSVTAASSQCTERSDRCRIAPLAPSGSAELELAAGCAGIGAGCGALWSPRCARAMCLRECRVRSLCDQLRLPAPPPPHAAGVPSPRAAGLPAQLARCCARGVHAVKDASPVELPPLLSGARVCVRFVAALPTCGSRLRLNRTPQRRPPSNVALPAGSNRAHGFGACTAPTCASRRGSSSDPRVSPRSASRPPGSGGGSGRGALCSGARRAVRCRGCGRELASARRSAGLCLEAGDGPLPVLGACPRRYPIRPEPAVPSPAVRLPLAMEHPSAPSAAVPIPASLPLAVAPPQAPAAAVKSEPGTAPAEGVSTPAAGDDAKAGADGADADAKSPAKAAPSTGSGRLAKKPPTSYSLFFSHRRPAVVAGLRRSLDSSGQNDARVSLQSRPAPRTAGLADARTAPPGSPASALLPLCGCCRESVTPSRPPASHRHLPVPPPPPCPVIATPSRHAGPHPRALLPSRRS